MPRKPLVILGAGLVAAGLAAKRAGHGHGHGCARHGGASHGHTSHGHAPHGRRHHGDRRGGAHRREERRERFRAHAETWLAEWHDRQHGVEPETTTV